MELSQARARAVWVELKGGVSPERMYTAGFGEYRPADSNATSKGRQVNRRVEIWLVNPPAAPTAESETVAPAAPVEAPAAEGTSLLPKLTPAPPPQNQWSSFRF